MKNLAKIAVIAILLMLSACASGPVPVVLPQLTPAQFVAQVCPIATTAGLAITAFPIFDPKVTLELAAARPVVDALCANGADVNIANVEDVAKTALPALLDAAGAANLDPAKLARIQLDIGAAQLIVNQVISTGFASASPVPATVK